MGPSNKAQELRELLALASKLRNYADASGEPHLVDLFVETAEALEMRAHRIADAPAACGDRLDINC
jgi:hypothetical protein